MFEEIENYKAWNWNAFKLRNIIRIVRRGVVVVLIQSAGWLLAKGGRVAQTQP